MIIIAAVIIVVSIDVMLLHMLYLSVMRSSSASLDDWRLISELPAQFHSVGMRIHIRRSRSKGHKLGRLRAEKFRRIQLVQCFLDVPTIFLHIARCFHVFTE